MPSLTSIVVPTIIWLIIKLNKKHERKSKMSLQDEIITAAKAYLHQDWQKKYVNIVYKTNKNGHEYIKLMYHAHTYLASKSLETSDMPYITELESPFQTRATDFTRYEALS